MEYLESQLRQKFASAVWTHKIQEKQADYYKRLYNINSKDYTFCNNNFRNNIKYFRR